MLVVYAGLALAYAGETVPLECRRSSGTGPPEPGVTITREDGNWSVEFSYKWGGGVFPKSQLFLRLRDAYGVDALGLFWFTRLTPANWTVFHVSFQDNHPASPDLCNGDRLVIDGGTFGSGSQLTIRDRYDGIIALYTLH